MDKKIVFCGGGNMAEGIIRGLINKGTSAENITVSELRAERCEYLKKTYGAAAVTDASTAIQAADIVVIAVLPQHVGSVTKTVKGLIDNNTLVISIAAAVKLETLEGQLGADKKIARVMPNTLGQTGHGYSAVCLNENVTQDEKELVTEVVEALGQAMFIREDMFNTFTAFSCSGPMWLYKMAEALINAGVYEGFSREDARKMVLENMVGVGQLLQMTGDSPANRVGEMCSPGGVTIEGFKSLQEEGFDAAIMTSVNKAVNKAKSL